MMRFLGWIFSSGVILAQSAVPAPQFDAADVHVSAKAQNPFFRNIPGRGRYELRQATMVDLIRTAYGVDADKVLAGPNWLEMDRYDVIARMPADAAPDSQKEMLQSLLADRFQLVIHKDTRPLPTYVLTAGKKPQIKEADGAGDTGCRPQAPPGPPAEGRVQLMMGTASGPPQQITLGPGMTIHYQCRNMTMAAFADALRTMLGANVGLNAVLDQTGLEGAWNFDVKWSMQFVGPVTNSGDRISTAEALEKQLGLKLEQKSVPASVIVVDSVNEKPTANPPEVAKDFPALPIPTEFEVADVKPTDPNASPNGRFQFMPGGRLVVQAMSLRFLVSRAFSTGFGMNYDSIAGLPKWAETERFDITAKVPAGGPPLDTDSVMPLMRALLVDRFKMAWHNEEKPMSAYSLVAGKPKMKKADPASRIYCKFPPPPAGAPPGTRLLACQNTTMAQLAERLQYMAPGLEWPVLDATGLEGTWDFTLTFGPSMGAGGPIRGGTEAGPGAPNAMPAASEPVSGHTLFQAIEKQLGLKLELQKRPIPVIVIDHIEQKATEN